MRQKMSKELCENGCTWDNKNSIAFQEKNLNFKILIKKNGDGLNYEILCQVVLLELNCEIASK